MKPSSGLIKQILILFIFILSIKATDAASNYKLTSVVDEVRGNLTSWIGKRQAIVNIGCDWCNSSLSWLFPLNLNASWYNHSISLVSWAPIECQGKYQSGIVKFILNHTFDDYINGFGDRLKNWLAGPDGIYGNEDDRRVYLRLAHEMNGNWYQWSTGSLPSEYVAAWRHVYDLLAQKGLESTRLQWVWSVSAVDVGQYTAEEYWVGENYTDWLGIDGYNSGADESWSKWQTPNEVFDNMLGRLRKLSSTKPICVNEYGSSSMRTPNVTDLQSKNEWIDQACQYLRNSTDIKFASYFNKDYPHDDWAVLGGAHGDTVWNNLKAYSAYKTCLQSNEWIETNMTNPRLITDDQFAGRF